jgi:GTP-binding protein EngB required for normal cell division
MSAPETDFTADAIRHYDALKLEIGAIAQSAMLRCAKLKDEEGERDFQRLLARLAEDRFNLAVVGPFSRGKSSLMNALLGLDVLPTGLLPHTSVVTTVTYGPRERVLIRCEGWSLAQEIRLGQLEEYVTERGNPGNRRRVAVAEIQLPVELLRRGLHLIDTPGVGSAIIANTTTTEKFLPEIDAAIFVSSFDSALSESEIEFMARVRAEVGVVFFVLNKLDLVSQAQGQEVVRFVRERVERDSGVGQCALFPVSAKHALEAKLNGNARALAASGLLALESALAQFLASDKTSQLAARILDRLIACLRRQREATALICAATRSGEERASTLRELDVRAKALKARLTDLSAGLEELGDDTLRTIETRIDAGLRRLGQSALKKFAAEDLRTKSRPRGPGVSVFDSDSVARELRGCEAALNEEWHRRADALSVQIRNLPAALFEQSAEVNGRDDHWLSLATTDAGTSELQLGQIVPIDLRPQRRWWPHAILRRFSAAPDKRLGRELDRALAHYRRQLQAAARAAISAYIGELRQEADKAIDARAERIRRSLADVDAAQDLQEFDRLLARARKAKSSIATAGAGMAQEDNGSSAAGSIRTPEDITHQVRTCPVCRAIAQAVFEHLSKLQYELGTEASAQEDLAEAGGFCAIHTWIYSTLTSPVGICRAYPRLLDAHAAKLELAARTASSPAMLARQVGGLSPSNTDCTVCALADSTAREVIRELLKGMESDAEIPALCMPHIELALSCGADLGAGRALVRATARALARVADDMRRYGLKHDGLRRNLVTSEERDAGQIGLRKLVGEMGLVMPARDDRA